MFHSKEEAQAFVAELRELRQLPKALQDCVDYLKFLGENNMGQVTDAEALLQSIEAATEKREAATEKGKKFAKGQG